MGVVISEGGLWWPSLFVSVKLEWFWPFPNWKAPLCCYREFGDCDQRDKWINKINRFFNKFLSHCCDCILNPKLSPLGVCVPKEDHFQLDLKIDNCKRWAEYHYRLQWPGRFYFIIHLMLEAVCEMHLIIHHHKGNEIVGYFWYLLNNCQLCMN